jgi:uncharacterized protein (TIGR02001 family)
MKIKTLGLFLVASCAFYAYAVHADNMPVGSMPAPVSLFSGDVQFRSNFVARGISQSQGQPSLQAEIDVNSGEGVYAGVDGDSINWIDQLYPGDSVDTEVDGWLGYRKRLGSGWTTKAGFVRIQFPGRYVQQSPPADEPNATEAFGYIAWKAFSAQLNYAVTNYVNTPDSKGTVYLSLSASQPVGGSWTLGAGLGRVAVSGRNPVDGQSNSRFNYTDYKLSIAFALGSGFSLTLAHTWTNANLKIYTLKGYAVAGHHTWLSLEKDF